MTVYVFECTRLCDGVNIGPMGKLKTILELKFKEDQNAEKISIPLVLHQPGDKRRNPIKSTCIV